MRTLQHPVTGELGVLVVGRDISARSAVEDMLVELTESQLGMVSQVSVGARGRMGSGWVCGGPWMLGELAERG